MSARLLTSLAPPDYRPLPPALVRVFSDHSCTRVATPLESAPRTSGTALHLMTERELMTKTLLEQLPGIVAAGKRQAGQVLDQLEGYSRVALQTRELVVPSKDVAQADMFRAASADVDISQPNRLIYGDNLLAMAALLADDNETPSMRNKIDLIYIDPPFDSKADYRTKVAL